MKRLNKNTYEKLWESVTQHWELQEGEAFDPQQANMNELKTEMARLQGEFEPMIEEWRTHIDRFTQGDKFRYNDERDGVRPEPWTEQDDEKLRKIKSMMESMLATYRDGGDQVQVDMGPAYG